VHNLSYKGAKVDKSSTKYAKSAYFQHIIGVAKQADMGNEQHMNGAESEGQTGRELQRKGGVP